ncbi:hypothetical protein AAF712_011559 [Marasmius tenuissimus]|uniref:Peptidase S33 tripeptidyl aminopeptidase-like C-terminal domain-containing protein n=1 Tax=Marasmius tenuissimus TaxID=585030 RepID=A0ABR2ZJ06_9AGAR
MDGVRSWKRLSILGACLISLTPVSGEAAWNESSWVAVRKQENHLLSNLVLHFIRQMQPSKDLQWVECYSGGFQCTRLQVPLNYSEPDGKSAAIALVRLPANVSEDSAEYRGPILFNPGGPGGSGVDQIMRNGSQFQALFPQWDIVGFDPRGVQRSTPQITFYRDTTELITWPGPIQELNHSSFTVESYWAQAKLRGILAYERNGDVLRYMNTENVARDMLAITQAYGKEKLQDDFEVDPMHRYGSVLGATFAAMFPDKMERLLIDGVADVQDDYTTKWLTSITDMDRTLQWFFKSCHEAGPDSCAFYEPSVEAISNRLNNLYDTLILSPILEPVAGSYRLIDYGFLRSEMVVRMYTPFSSWPTLASALAALEQGNATALYNSSQEALSIAQAAQAGAENGTVFEKHPEDRIAYVCNDGDFVPPELEEAQRHYREMTEFSSFGSIWASWRIACSAWSRSIPKAAFRGPIAGNTSFPILLIGNTADPITPLAAARKVSSNFPGSVVLQQDAPGHPTSILSAPSECTRRVIIEYFVNGTLPREGTVCPLDRSPFDLPSEGESA